MYGWDAEVRAEPLASRWRFNDARGSSTAADAVGGAAGTVRGSLAFAQPSLIPSDPDGAALFNGTDSFILVADRAGVKVTGNGAIEFVIRPTRYTDARGLRGCIYDGGTGEVLILWAPTLDGRLLVRCNSVGDICTSLGTIPLDTTTHGMVVFTTSGGRVSARIIINGADQTGTVTPQTVTPNALAKTIGGADQGTGNLFSGTIDELSIINSVTPTQQRARAHYRAMFDVPLTYARSLGWLDQTFPLATSATRRVLKPRGAKRGDLICLALRIDSTTLTPSHPDWILPRGGLQTNATASKNHELAFLWHRVDVGDPASWDIALGGNVQHEGWARVVRGAPLTGDPIDVIAGAATATAGSSVAFAGAVATARGLTMCVWSRFAASGFPTQPDHWHFGAGQSGGIATVGAFERQQGGPGKLPYMTNFAGSSDAWTSLQVVIKDGGLQNPAVNLAIGLAGVNSPNDASLRGWPDGYTPALAIGSNFIRMDFYPGKPQADCDVEFADAARRGMRVLPMLNQYSQLSTINKATFARYVADFCARYGPGGAFWNSRRDGYLAPVYFELFNEPYGVWFNHVTLEPDVYADIFIQSVRAGRAANPRCKFLLAGADYGYDGARGGWNEWLRPMFVAQPTLGDYVDGVTVHLYGTSPLDLAKWANNWEWPQVDYIASNLTARGLDMGGRVKIWITEAGFNTASNQGAGDYGMTEADQASQWLAALRIIFGRWCDLVAGVFPYRYRDGTVDDKEGKVGIVRNDGTDKPAKTALSAVLPQFTGAAVHVWNGDQWMPCPVYVYDGAQWVRPPSFLLP